MSNRRTFANHLAPLTREKKPRSPKSCCFKAARSHLAGRGQWRGRGGWRRGGARSDWMKIEQQRRVSSVTLQREMTLPRKRKPGESGLYISNLSNTRGRQTARRSGFPLPIGTHLSCTHGPSPQVFGIRPGLMGLGRGAKGIRPARTPKAVFSSGSLPCCVLERAVHLPLSTRSTPRKRTRSPSRRLDEVGRHAGASVIVLVPRRCGPPVGAMGGRVRGGYPYGGFAPLHSYRSQPFPREGALLHSDPEFAA